MNEPLRLHKITFVHYSPKDSKEGILRYVVASDEEQVVQHLAGSDLLYSWEDWERDGDEDSVEPMAEWWDDNPDAVDRAKTLGLTLHLYDWGDRIGQPNWVEGKKTDVVRWWRGDTTEVSDLYYGATRVYWDAGVAITPADAEVLTRLGIATDLTGSP